MKVMQVWRIGMKHTQGQGAADEAETLVVAPKNLRAIEVRKAFLDQYISSEQWQKDGSVALGNITIAVSTCYVLEG